MLSKKEFLALPIEERRRLLRESAEKAAKCETCPDWKGCEWDADPATCKKNKPEWKCETCQDKHECLRENVINCPNYHLKPEPSATKLAQDILDHAKPQKPESTVLTDEEIKDFLGYPYPQFAPKDTEVTLTFLQVKKVANKQDAHTRHEDAKKLILFRDRFKANMDTVAWNELCLIIERLEAK